MSNCIKCGKPTKTKSNKYCSKECAGLLKRTRPKCHVCGNTCKRSTAKYCSTKCYDEAKKGKRQGGPVKKWNLKRSCQTCGKEFEVPTNNKDQKYCSRHCMGKARGSFMQELGRSWKGVPKSIEQRNKQSQRMAQRPAPDNFTKAKGGIRPDIGHYVRSTWEANIARILIHEGIKYAYEPDIFRLVKDDGSIISYCPDFYLLGRYIEVKGWWDSKSLLKKKLMKEQYPHIVVEYVSEKEYKELSQYYKEVLEWEI